ncbi:MAG: hypothetical protein ABJB76_06300 [Candidatus Nitrosocosmicus sp.]
MHSYDRLSKKPILLKSLTDLTVKEFDDIYDKETTKRYDNHERQRLSSSLPKRKDKIKQIIDPRERHYLDVKNRFIMLLIYYRLKLTCTPSCFCLTWIKLTFIQTSKRLSHRLESVYQIHRRYTK